MEISIDVGKDKNAAAKLLTAQVITLQIYRMQLNSAKLFPSVISNLCYRNVLRELFNEMIIFVWEKVPKPRVRTKPEQKY